MGFIPDSTLEQIRAASDIVEIIGAVVPLKRAGANFVGLCPFHREKTPSFNVNPSKQIFRCFGCGKGGDVFKFLQEYESLTFPDAIRRLAERANIVIQEDNTPGAAENRQSKDKLLAIHEQLTQRWQSALNNEAAGQIARDYVAKRGISPEAVQLFRIGWAPDAWDDTVNWAKSKGFDPQLVADAGLIIPREGDNGHYDRFRARLMFPICDEQGRVVAFSGRTLDPNEERKYVNSPETLLFKKGRIIFGLDKAKRAILDKQFAVVCEGQLDMIACYMAGVQNAVAPQGTAFTGDQARLLKRYAKEVVLCFDSDNAGQKAAVRALDDLLQSGLSIRVATLPAPHDPDSYVKEFGAAALQDRMNAAVGFFDFYLQLLLKQNDINTDRGQREVARAMSTALAKTSDQFLFDKYARETAARFGADPLNAIAAFRKLAAENAPRPSFRETIYDDEPPHEEEMVQLAPPSPAELWIVKIAMLHDDILEWLAAHLDFAWIQDDRVRELLELRLHQNEDGTWSSPPQVLRHLDHNPHAQDLLTEVTTEARAIKEPLKVLTDSLLRLRNQSIDREIAGIANERGAPDISPERFAQLTRRHFELHQARAKPLTPREP